MRSNAVILIALTLLSGCAHYQVGSTGDPALNTIRIGRIHNATDEPRLNAWLRGEFAAGFMRDGSMNVVNDGTADCILNATITNYELHQIGQTETASNDRDQRLARTIIWAVDVRIEYTIERADGSAYIAATTASGRAEFSEIIDLDVVRKDGLRQAVYDAAGQVVANATAPW
ncbi:MAG: LPS assembly lipoprotein LptE [Lentisphaeria bacterium]|jgi:hypothetical protein|nr:LPS assembly lipoprotein LptE [Lentisphaeria bacterium]MDP7740476.1 LPS assembly lipoprotein LptE [Lentisphaeria bacterium]